MPQAIRSMTSVLASHQEANGQPYSEWPISTPRLSPVPVHPILIRESIHPANARLSRRDAERLLASLTQRDFVILATLDSYRYLNVRQLQELFFPSVRSAQLRLKHLADHGLVLRWRVLEPPGFTRRHSLFLASVRGARVLAASQGEPPEPTIRRSQDAQDHCFSVVHDLAANDFFVGLAVASRGLADQGLYHWSGEALQRAHVREIAGRRRRDAAPTPDGSGRYLTPRGEVVFDLELDRGTAPLPRLRRKVLGYIKFHKDRANAEFHHVLFVLPTAAREEGLRGLVWHESPASAWTGCRFWTTTRDLLRDRGPLGGIWLYAPPREQLMVDRARHHDAREPAILESEDDEDETTTLDNDSEQPDFSDARHVDWAAVEWGDYSTFNRWRDALQQKADRSAEEDWIADDDHAEAPGAEREPDTDQVPSDDDDRAGTTESLDGDQPSRQQSDARYSLADLASRPAPLLDVAACVGKLEWWNRRPGGGEGA